MVVVTWNARSLAQEEATTAPKLNGLVDILRRIDPDVLCLQETWMKGEKWTEVGNIIESMGWYVTYSQHGGPGCGMATLTRKARGPRPVITKDKRGKELQVVWNSTTITNVHFSKKDSHIPLAAPGTTHHVMCGDWNDMPNHRDITLKTTCWPSAATTERRRAYDHILSEGATETGDAEIIKGPLQRGWAGSDHAAVGKSLTFPAVTGERYFPMWRPKKEDKEINRFNTWVQEERPNAISTVTD